MTVITRLAVLVVMSLFTAASAGAEGVQIYANGKLRGSLIPALEPYATGGPAVSVFLVDKQDVKMSDGKVLTGFKFTAWREGERIRVNVFALVPRSGAPNVYLPGGEERNLTARDFGTHLVEAGDTITLDKMRQLGLSAMELRVTDK